MKAENLALRAYQNRKAKNEIGRIALIGGWSRGWAYEAKKRTARRWLGRAGKAFVLVGVVVLVVSFGGCW